MITIGKFGSWCRGNGEETARNEPKRACFAVFLSRFVFVNNFSLRGGGGRNMLPPLPFY